MKVSLRCRLFPASSRSWLVGFLVLTLGPCSGICLVRRSTPSWNTRIFKRSLLWISCLRCGHDNIPVPTVFATPFCRVHDLLLHVPVRSPVAVHDVRSGFSSELFEAETQPRTRCRPCLKCRCMVGHRSQVRMVWRSVLSYATHAPAPHKPASQVGDSVTMHGLGGNGDVDGLKARFVLSAHPR